MTSYEASHNGESASSQELGRLYDSTRRWLIDNGEYTPDDDQTDVSYGGLPVLSSGDYFGARVLGDKLRARLPLAAAILAVGACIDIAYHMPYALRDDDGNYSAAGDRVQIHIEKSAASPYESETLFIDKSGDGFDSDRLQDVRGSGPQAHTSNPEEALERTVNYSAAMHLEDSVGLTDITRAEHGALQIIIEHLDVLT